MELAKPWFIVEVVHPELRPTRFAHRDRVEADIDAILFAAGLATASHDRAHPYPNRYPLIVYSWRAGAYDAPRPAAGCRKTRARHATYAEARDRSMAIRKATSWGRLPQVMRAALLG